MFLEKIFEGKKESDYVLIWDLKTKKSSWIKDLSTFEERFKNNKNDIFFGLGTSSSNNGETKRCKAKDIAGLGCLYLDIDYGNNHKKESLPPTLDDALELANSIGVEPSIVNMSGNGIHAFYLFEDFQNFENSKQRKRLQILEKQLNQKCQKIAKQKEWSVDSIFDLARVLRIPDTFNCKDPNNKIKVATIVDNNIRYSIDELEDILISSYDLLEIENNETNTNCNIDINIPDHQIKENNEEQNSSGMDMSDMSIEELAQALFVSEKRQIPSNKFADIIDIENPVFIETWKRERKVGDSSPSEYDLSLATMAVRNRWTEQEICDLLVNHRLKHGSNIKANNKQYYARTILKAKEANRLANDPLNKKKLSLDFLSNAFECKILGIKKFIQDPLSKWFITVEFGNKVHEFQIGTSAEIQKQHQWEIAFIDNLNFRMQKKSTRQWDQVITQTLSVVQNVYTSSTAKNINHIRELIKEFLEKDEIYTNIEEAKEDKAVYITQDHIIHYYLDVFSSWVLSSKNTAFNKNDFNLNLFQLGHRELNGSNQLWSAPSYLTKQLNNIPILKPEQTQT